MATKCIRFILACCSVVFLLALSTPGQKEQKKSNKGKEKPAAAANTGAASEPALADKFKALEFREIGPAVMGGRIDDFAAVESNPNIVYVGVASGGVWKTTNNGTTWESVFDQEGVSTVGDIAIAPSDPSVIWVGSGEANNRQSSSWGD